ncbi:hypothetical protein [Streptomyces cupreus]|uniref:Uncharacterized protein n=1 Tax=Streptomyces cupreus TaxID=2759956 RepID=A0A7X1IX44_9ACTN|nr:hypothetical protein [Streptomyces cupreus]MBC2900181.1 hypothetical protein [Streptomyces cupreus]
MSGLFGEHDPLLWQGAPPPLAGGGVDGGPRVPGSWEPLSSVVRGAIGVTPTLPSQ